MPNTRPNKNIPSEQENPLFHDTWKLLKNYRDAVWNLELAVQIDLQSNNILIYGKGAKERIIQLGNQEVIAALVLYQETYRKDVEVCGYFFVNRLRHKLSDQSVRLMINRYAELAGISQHITPHMFRHSFATLLLEQDVDIRYIQRMLGHSSISTTEIYTHVSNAKQKDILIHKHPRNLMEVNKG